MTIDDLRNPKRASGFNYVNTSTPNGRSTTYYQAHGGRGSNGFVWRGTTRGTPEEAAQDAVDYFNGNPISPSVPSGRAGVKRAGHVFDGNPEPIPSDIEAAYGMIRDFKAQQAGKQGYVYLIVEDVPGAMFGKVGYSVNPQKRVAELQTGNPRRLKLYATRLGSLEDERDLHARHLNDNVLQEWFRLTGPLLSEFPTTTEEAT